MTQQFDLPLRARKKRRAIEDHPVGCACVRCKALLAIEVEAIKNEPLTRCAYLDFNTCRAQHCGGYAPFLDGPPFCAACRESLPPLTLRRLVAEWEKAFEPTEDCTVDEHRVVASKRRPGKVFEMPTGRTYTYKVRDLPTIEAKLRRLEIQTAWTLRAIRRVSPLHLA